MARNYRIVVNVGCAEGYYTVGLARCMLKAHVYAFDIDERAACRANAIENGVLDRITINAACEPYLLGEIAALDPDMLLVLDCEAYELPLLTSEKGFAAVRHADLVIETHDCLNRTIVPKLVEKFLPTPQAVLPTQRRAQSEPVRVPGPDQRPRAMDDGVREPSRAAELAGVRGDRPRVSLAMSD